METKTCFEPGCNLEVEYKCPCSSPETYCCLLHFGKHVKLPNREHKFESIFAEPYAETKEALLGFLMKKKLKCSNLKKNIANSFNKRRADSEKDLNELMRNLKTYTGEINNFRNKISQAKKLSRSEEDPVLELLSLQPSVATERLKKLIPAKSDWYDGAKVFCSFNEKIEKIIELFIKDKFEAHLDERLFKIESTLEENTSAINLANNELENVKDSISSIISENKNNQKKFEEWMETIKEDAKNEINSLNSQISSITEDYNLKINEAFKAKIKKNKKLTPQELRDMRSKILNQSNDHKLEQEFRKTCLVYENDVHAYDPPLIQAYTDLINDFHQRSSLYTIRKNDNKTALYTYGTEIKNKNPKIIETPEPLDIRTSITQIPDCEFFCFGNNPISGIALIIDRKFEVHPLPYGTPCWRSSGIYFNRNVYFFGGFNGENSLKLSEKFDLDKIQWSKLAPLPQADNSCNIIMHNGNFLISGFCNKNLLRYSHDSNNFETIPFQFEADKRKILINEERLYLIECNGFIYESEIESDSEWRQIGDSIIKQNDAIQVYCAYNKGETYIGCSFLNEIKYYKFNLSEKVMSILI